MAAANASARGQRTAILASPLHELAGFYLAVDCLAPRCNGERTFTVAELATFYGRDSTVGQVLRRMRCSGACGGRVGAAWKVGWSPPSTVTDRARARSCSDRPRDDWLRRMKIGPYRDDGTAQRSIFEVLRFLSQNSGVCHIN